MSDLCPYCTRDAEGRRPLKSGHPFESAPENLNLRIEFEPAYGPCLTFDVEAGPVYERRKRRRHISYCPICGRKL